MITYCVRFFPAAGERHRETGLCQNRGRYGCYWSSSKNNITGGWSTLLTTTTVHLNVTGHTFGYSVRCVAQGFSNYNCFFCSFVYLVVLLDK